MVRNLARSSIGTSFLLGERKTLAAGVSARSSRLAPGTASRMQPLSFGSLEGREPGLEETDWGHLPKAERVGIGAAGSGRWQASVQESIQPRDDV